jgi:DNA-directed RNA polymerase beta subunit
MARRLYLFTEGKLLQDNPDSTANHDVLLVGHLFTMLMSEQIQVGLKKCSWGVMRLKKEGKFEYTEKVMKSVIRNPELE